MSTTKLGDPQYWLDKWEHGNADWHLKDVNPWLSANVQLLTDGREHIKVFIPLCGKCVEIKWLADMGHTVVGVDLSSTAFQQFFSDFGLNYTVNSIPECNGSVYKSADGNIRLYCCSIFEFTNALEGLFDAVWDRAAMVALPPELTKKYHTVLKSLMAPGCQYIVELFDYATPRRKDPPIIIPLETIQENFGSEYKVELLERIPSQYFKEKFDASYLNIEMVRIVKA